MRLLVDTNVILDIILQREESYKDALEFFVWCIENNNRTYVSSMSLRDIEYFTMKKLHDKETVKRALNNVYTLVSKIVGVSADAAINSIFEDYNDFEDELIIQAAKEEMVDAIITSNIKDFENRGIPVLTPKQIVSMSSFNEI